MYIPYGLTLCLIKYVLLCKHLPMMCDTFTRTTTPHQRINSEMHRGNHNQIKFCMSMFIFKLIRIFIILYTT